jgi:hypothetical protein
MKAWQAGDWHKKILKSFCIVMAECDLVYHNWRTNPESYVQSWRDTSNDRRCSFLLDELTQSTIRKINLREH